MNTTDEREDADTKEPGKTVTMEEELAALTERVAELEKSQVRRPWIQAGGLIAGVVIGMALLTMFAAAVQAP